MEIKLKVSGNIISELSDKIPNSFMAFNELIKNAYDADAPKVSIDISTKTQTITITDNGNGMNLDKIKSLLHIANSNKNYAELRPNNRITQGQKGLGALAPFYFGNKIVWTTSENGSLAYRFTLNKNDLLKLDDISNYKVYIEQCNSAKGTKIEISDIEQFDFILTKLKEKNTTSKLMRSLFYSDNDIHFETILTIDGEVFIKEEDLKISKKCLDRQIYNVLFDSKKSLIEFYYKDNLVFEETFEIDKLLNDFHIKCNLNIFHLGDGVKSTDFPALYLKETANNITPLVYINQGFFKNYIVFNTDALRSKRSTETLPQITGEIEIITGNSELQFNSDRTDITENTTTSKLLETISNLNKTIQEAGAKVKDAFVYKSKGISMPPDKFLKSSSLSFKYDGNINNFIRKNLKPGYEKIATSTLSGDNIILNILDEKYSIPLNKNNSTIPNKDTNLKPAKILLKKHSDKKYIPSDQFNLQDYLDEIISSKGISIDFDKIDILINEEKLNNYIYPSINEEKKITVIYQYNDIDTGLVQNSLCIEFKEQTTPVYGGDNQNTVIYYPGEIQYKTNYSTTVSNLVNQINKLNLQNFREVIVSSIRPLFEISVNTIASNDNKFFIDNNNKPINSLDDKVSKVIQYVSDNHKLKNQISQSINMPSLTLRNMLSKNEPEAFKNIISKAHLAAHHSTLNLTNNDIDDLRKRTGIFLVFTNEIIKYLK